MKLNNKKARGPEKSVSSNFEVSKSSGTSRFARNLGWYHFLATSPSWARRFEIYSDYRGTCFLSSLQRDYLALSNFAQLIPSLELSAPNESPYAICCMPPTPRLPHISQTTIHLVSDPRHSLKLNQPAKLSHMPLSMSSTPLPPQNLAPFFVP